MIEFSIYVVTDIVNLLRYMDNIICKYLHIKNNDYLIIIKAYS